MNKKGRRSFGYIRKLPSKLALVMLMNHMADEYKNIRIISLNPDAIDTKMVR
jgi:NAD(P)-dependent dehydrogenase (short-subunit alcohol dehydrogenase family)